MIKNIKKRGIKVSQADKEDEEKNEKIKEEGSNIKEKIDEKGEKSKVTERNIENKELADKKAKEKEKSKVTEKNIANKDLTDKKARNEEKTTSEERINDEEKKQSPIKSKKLVILKKVFLTILVIGLLIALIALTKIVVFFGDNKEYGIDEKKIDVPIFLYHEVVSIRTKPEPYMQTEMSVFKKQIEDLKKLGYKFISYDDLLAYYNGSKKITNKSVVLTLDDGYLSNYTELYPVLKEMNLHVAINIINDNVGTPNYMTWDQLREMSDSGLVDIYSHGEHHLDATTMNTEDFVKDVVESHKNIEENLGRPVKKIFTYPYGLYNNEKVMALFNAGFIQNLTDNKINHSELLNFSKLHRSYPLSDPVWKILLKVVYRDIRYHD